MRFYWPIAKLDTERQMVWGYASTEVQDEQGETVTCNALAAALDDYMRFANIREMHQPSAIGIAKEAAVDERGLYLGAKIVDGHAWRKVVEGVYKGFSIGGRVTARDPADRRLITGLRLTEISVVDRPANPEAVFDCWKLSGGSDGEPVDAHSQTMVEPVASNVAGEHGATEPSTTSDPPALDRLQELVEILCDTLGALLGRLAGETEPQQGGVASLAAMTTTGALCKMRVPVDTASEPGFVKLAGEILPRLDALQQRVDEIARTPLPPQTAARGFIALTKREDVVGPGAPSDDIVSALARMSEEQRTLTLIKAAHASPIGAGGRPMR